MQDLRLIGVHEDGGHLLFADMRGTRYRVRLDEALRAATRQHRGPHAAASAEVEAGHRPREVQALIRAGLSAQEVAERCGWPVEKVHRYEVPILAEREYVAGLARLVRLRSRGSSSQASPTFQQRVTDRLATRGVESDDMSWDAWRQSGAQWTVVLTFPAGGKQRQATWSFDPATNGIHPRDDEARWLSEDEAVPYGAAVVREVPVYDVEAEGGVGAEPAAASSDPVDLVTAMRQRTTARARRGARRRPAEVASLPLDAGVNGEAAPAPSDVAQASSPAPHGPGPAVEHAAPVETEEKADPEAAAEENEAASPAEAAPNGVAHDVVHEGVMHEGVANEDVAHEDVAHHDAGENDPAAELNADPTRDQTPGDQATDDQSNDAETQRPSNLAQRNGSGESGQQARPTRRTGRVPVPSWEDVILGTKPPGDEA